MFEFVAYIFSVHFVLSEHLIVLIILASSLSFYYHEAFCKKLADEFRSMMVYLVILVDSVENIKLPMFWPTSSILGYGGA